ncbi:hypothetical protein Poli38472_004239 [Pythium oligandrum]|uniref:Uncharacterized protein n=1 Tax=Pythium oligandrum TaxID=41045 RepID=A0A8K1CMZ6_PYTOL|nr:hypothetical protein Poli38472_004239 [Pythium oligandrum]|eukprot:TMW66474.1 hypothetical protein Poli38472_004239 [Pythium oligandrum]
MEEATPQSGSPPPPPASMEDLPRRLVRVNSQTSNDSFVCNVSDDEVMERDIDLEIEARMRSTTISSSAAFSASYHHPPRQNDSPQSSGKSTMSQRMLRMLAKNRQAASMRSLSTKAKPLTVPETHTVDTANRSTRSIGSEMDGLVAPDPYYDHTKDSVCLSDDDATSSARTTGSYSMASSKDRLEARISEKLHNKSMSDRPDSLSEDPDADHLAFSGRRTYPAEAPKKEDQRFSEREPIEQKKPTLMDRILERDRRERELRELEAYNRTRNERVQPSLERMETGPKQPLPVAFQFKGESDPRPNPASRQTRAQTMFPEQSSSDDQAMKLAASLGEIEKVVEGLASLLMAGAVASMASMALRELELLQDSTTHIRTNGTSLILAEVGRPNSESLDFLRRVVARAVKTQNRIGGLIASIKANV